MIMDLAKDSDISNDVMIKIILNRELLNWIFSTFSKALFVLQGLYLCFILILNNFEFNIVINDIVFRCQLD